MNHNSQQDCFKRVSFEHVNYWPKSCILGATIFKIPQLNSALYKRRFQMGINPNVDHRLLRPLGPFTIQRGRLCISIPQKLCHVCVWVGAVGMQVQFLDRAMRYTNSNSVYSCKYFLVKNSNNNKTQRVRHFFWPLHIFEFVPLECKRSPPVLAYVHCPWQFFQVPKIVVMLGPSESHNCTCL